MIVMMSANSTVIDEVTREGFFRVWQECLRPCVASGSAGNGVSAIAALARGERVVPRPPRPDNISDGRQDDSAA